MKKLTTNVAKNHPHRDKAEKCLNSVYHFITEEFPNISDEAKRVVVTFAFCESFLCEEDLCQLPRTLI